MNNHNESNKIIINFIYQCRENIIIETDINNKFETSINELCSRLNIDKASIFFLYNGNTLSPDDFDKSISYVISSNDRQIKKMNILVYKKDLESDPENEVIQLDDINIMLIIDSSNVYEIKEKKNESLKTIIQNENSEIKLGLNKFEFKYRNQKINLDKKFEDIADEYDKKINRIPIEANHKEKVIVKFVNDKFGEKRIICFPQDIIENVIKNHFFEIERAHKFKNDVLSNYYFKYKNKDINLSKTIDELRNDDNNPVTDASMYKFDRENNPNIDPNEPNEIEISVIKKPCWVRYKCIFLSTIITLIFGSLGVVLNVIFQKKNK